MKTEIILLDIVAIILTAIWIIRGVVLGLSSADLIYNFIYSSIVLTSLILTMYEVTIKHNET